MENALSRKSHKAWSLLGPFFSYLCLAECFFVIALVPFLSLAGCMGWGIKNVWGDLPARTKQRPSVLCFSIVK